jgi:S-phase kinase-associated protein 1
MTTSNITLISSDNVSFVVSLNVITTFSAVIRDMLSDVSDEITTIPLSNIDSIELSKIIHFCEYHLQHPEINIKDYRKNSDLKITNSFDNEISGNVDGSEIDSQCKLMRDANFLNIKPLVRLMSIKIASMIKGKNAEEIKTLLKIPDVPNEQAIPMIIS